MDDDVIVSAPALLARASGQPCTGPYRCEFCAAPAARPHALSETFTTRDTLRCPGSGRVCAGCVLALEEAGTATYPDGSTYAFAKGFRRMCSHVITRDAVTCATKAHLAYLRRVCLDPPAPPVAISLAVSGQKHVLYRVPVTRGPGTVSVGLEGEPIRYERPALRDRLALCGRIAAATGKPALAEPAAPSVWFRVCERYAGGEALCAEWSRVREEPVSRLAAFLCPNKEECAREYPGDRHGGVPPPGGGVDRPRPEADRRGRNRERQGGKQAPLFDVV